MLDTRLEVVAHGMDIAGRFKNRVHVLHRIFTVVYPVLQKKKYFVEKACQQPGN